MMIWKLWDCCIACIDANIITQYYLFPYWLSSDPSDDGHFAHFADRQHCFSCVTYLAVFVLSSLRSQAYCLSLTYS